MPPKRDKTTGLPLPSPVTPATNICLTITIPNASEYKQALRGVIAELGKYWTWQQTVGQSSDDALEAAELWRAAARTMTYSEECAEEMSCADVANCIETDEAARAAVAGVAGQSAQPGTTATPGERLPDSKWAANLTPTDDCNLDAFWSQCETFVDYTVTAGIDFLETLETYSNAVEASAFIELAPVIGTVMDEAQIDQVIAFIDWCLEVVQEAFVSADNQPNRQAIACALFCAMRADCELSLEGAFDVINDRLGGVLTPSDLDSTESLITAAVTIATNPAFPLDTWLAIVLALGRTMGYLGVQGINQSLNLMLKVAAGAPSDAWRLLCTDCPPDPEECETAQASQDFRISASGFVVSHPEFDYAEYHAGSGWSTNPPANTFTISVERAFTQQVNRVRVYVSSDWPIQLFVRTLRNNGWGVYTPLSSSQGQEGSLFWYEQEISPNNAGICYQIYNPSIGIPDDFRLVRACEWWE